MKELSKNDIIAVDLGDITKEYSKKMENISEVADGSDGHKIKNGYWLLGAVAINIESQEKTPLPIELEIFSSSEMNFSSENGKIKSLLNKISQVFKDKPIEERAAIVMDRGGDRKILIEHLISKELPFVIRLCQRYLWSEENEVDKKKEIIKIGKRTLNRNDLAYAGSLKRTEYNNPTKTFEFRFDHQKVSIPSIKTKTQFYLVTIWGENAKKPIELLTNKTVESEEDAVKIIISYLSRWSIEEMYKFLKGSGLEEVRAFNYTAIKNLIAISFLASVFISREIKYDPSFIQIVQKINKSLRKHSKYLFNWMNQGAVFCAEFLSKIIEEILKKTRTRRLIFFA